MNWPALSAAHIGAPRGPPSGLRRCVRWVAVPATTLVLLVVLVGTTMPSVREAVLRPVPSGLRAVATSYGQADLGPRLPQPALPGRVQHRCVDGGRPGRDVRRQRGHLTGLAPGRRYYLRVAAADADGEPLSDYTPAAYPSARTLYRGGSTTSRPRAQGDRGAGEVPVAGLVARRPPPATGDDRDRQEDDAGTHPLVRLRPGQVGHLKPGKRYFVTVSVARRTAASPALSRDTRCGPHSRSSRATLPKLDPPAIPKPDVPTTWDLRVASWNILASINKPWGPRATPSSPAAGVAGRPDVPPPDAIALQEAIPYGQFQDVVSGLNAIGDDGAHYSGHSATAATPGSCGTTTPRPGAVRRDQVPRSGAPLRRLRMAPWAVSSQAHPGQVLLPQCPPRDRGRGGARTVTTAPA